jgi:uncharacterized protein YggE
MKRTLIAAIVVAAVAAAALAASARTQSPTAPAADGARTISVAGAGKVSTAPDEAHFSFGVERQAESARQAFSAATTTSQRIVAALRSAGVAAGDIQSEQISIVPRTSENGREIVCYAATSSVSATIRNIGRAGAVIDAAVEAGANQVYGPSLTVSSQERVYREALRSALADARAKAQTIASASGVSLGAVVSVQESGEAPAPVALEAASRAADQAQIEPGTEEIEARLVVTFAIQ